MTWTQSRDDTLFMALDAPALFVLPILTLAARLVAAQAALTGKLADPTDLPFTDDLLNDDGLVDEAKVQAAIDDLIKRKPHLAARRPTGDVGQGARPETPEMGLAAMLRRGA